MQVEVLVHSKDKIRLGTLETWLDPAVRPPTRRPAAAGGLRYSGVSPLSSACGRPRAVFPSGGRRRREAPGAGQQRRRESAPGAGIGSMPHFITRSKTHWSVVSPRVGHPGTALRICCTAHKRNHRVARLAARGPWCGPARQARAAGGAGKQAGTRPVRAAAAPTRLAAALPFLFVFPRKFAASCIAFCSPKSLAHEQGPMRKSTIRCVPVFQIPILMPFCLDCSSGRTQFLILCPHFSDLRSQTWFVCSPKHLDCKIEISIRICPLKVGWRFWALRPTLLVRCWHPIWWFSSSGLRNLHVVRQLACFSVFVQSASFIRHVSFAGNWVLDVVYASPQLVSTTLPSLFRLKLSFDFATKLPLIFQLWRIRLVCQLPRLLLVLRFLLLHF